jgi:hypothetical protein
MSHSDYPCGDKRRDQRIDVLCRTPPKTVARLFNGMPRQPDAARLRHAGPAAVAAMLTYLLAHALIKSGIFFMTGIMLHRLRSISE